MKIARKFTVALVACVLVALAVNTGSVVRSEIARFESEITAHQTIMGRALRPAIAQVWRTDGRARALEVVDEANNGLKRVDIRWVWLNALADEKWRPQVPTRDLDPVGRGETITLTTRAAGTPGRMLSYIPVTIPGEPAGALEISEPLDREEDVRKSALAHAVFTGLAITLASALATGILGAWFVGRPMRGLVAQADRIGAGDLSRRIAVRQRDEIGTLAAAMDVMCDRLVASQAREARAIDEQLRALEQLRHADRLATVGRLAAGMAHELGTPLNVVSARAKTISSGIVDGDAARDAARIVGEQVDRMTRLMRQLLDFARKRQVRKVRTDVRTVVRRTVTFLGSLAAKRGVTVDVLGDDAPIEADVDAALLEQVVTNLVVNALDASASGQSVGITLARREAEPPVEDGRGPLPCAVIEVRDHGQGIPEDHLPRIFEPFFTTKEVGEGTGLGLSVSYGIVREHDGWIAVDSAPAAGSRFVVYLPLGT